ncbi:MAG: GTPase Era [Fibrobacterota bacterium]
MKESVFSGIDSMHGDDKKRYSGIVCIAGRPNTGKSTLLNRIVNRKISIVSDKPQTTRDRIIGIYTKDSKQIIFYDTPGIGEGRGRLSGEMNRIAEETMTGADLYLFVIDGSSGFNRDDASILTKLSYTGRPVVAVLNKSDKTGEAALVPSADILRKQKAVSEIIPVSAKTGDNVDSLIPLLLNELPENPLIFDEGTVTDQPPAFIISEFVREQIYINSYNEIPYGVSVSVRRLEYSESGDIQASCEIFAEKQAHKKILIGRGGALLKKIRRFAERRLKEFFTVSVKLELWVRIPGN